MRSLGIWAYEPSYRRSLLTEQKKLFLESYFPNIMCAAIGVSSFFNFPFSIFTLNRDDIFNLAVNALERTRDQGEGGW